MNPGEVLKVKAAVRSRDGFRCVECGVSNEEHVAQTGRQLDVHRITPGGPYVLSACVTLCRRCHGPKAKSPRGTGPRLAGGRVVLCVRLHRSVGEALDAFIEGSELPPGKSDVVELALKEFLAKRGHWPPPAG